MVAETALVWAQVAAAFVTAIATIALFCVTWVLARETKRLAKATSQPSCVVTFEPSMVDPLRIEQVVQNTGTGTAFDVTVVCEPPLPPIRDDMETTGFSSIGALRPGQTTRTLAGSSKTLAEKEADLSVSWAERPGSPQRTCLCYRSRMDGGVEVSLTGKTIHHVAKELEILRRGILQGQKSPSDQAPHARNVRP